MAEPTPDPRVIEPVAPEDHDAWLPLWRAYQTFYKVDIDAATTARTWARFNDPQEPVWAALAWRGDGAVGFAHWIFHRSTWAIGDYCYFNDLFVDPALRGAGVGRRLIAHVYAEADKAGCPRVYWLTHQTNRRAMALYDTVAEQSGFLHYGKTM